MSAHEIAMITDRYRERIAALLTPEEVARYDAYERRLQATVGPNDLSPIAPTPAEKAVLDKIAADERAAVLHKQLLVLLRIETLPQ